MLNADNAAFNQRCQANATYLMYEKINVGSSQRQNFCNSEISQSGKTFCGTSRKIQNFVEISFKNGMMTIRTAKNANLAETWKNLRLTFGFFSLAQVGNKILDSKKN